MRSCTINLVIVAAVAAVGCTRSTPPAPVVVPDEPSASGSADASASSSPSGAPMSIVFVDAGPADASAESAPMAAIVVEHGACRSIGPVFKLQLFADGGVAFDGVNNVAAMGSRRASIDPALVSKLVDSVGKAGLASWGDIHCTPTAARRCSMHPCPTILTVMKDGQTTRASVSDDAASIPRAFGVAIADIERTAGVWAWIGEGRDWTPAACTSSHDCSVSPDRCGGLHAVAVGASTHVEVADCALSLWPKSNVEPACTDGHCAMAAVDDDKRACKRNADCAVVVECSTYGAVRADKVRELAVRNESKQCGKPEGAPPAAACLQRVCVTRSKR